MFISFYDLRHVLISNFLNQSKFLSNFQFGRCFSSIYYTFKCIFLPENYHRHVFLWLFAEFICAWAVLFALLFCWFLLLLATWCVLVLRCRQNDQIVNFNAISLIYAHDEFLMMFSRPNFDKRRYILMLHTFILNSHIECGCHIYFYSSYNYKDIFFISAIRISFLHSSTFSLFVLFFFPKKIVYAPVVKIMEWNESEIMVEKPKNPCQNFNIELKILL